jgi:hypothetical protein
MTKVIHNGMRCTFLGHPYRVPQSLVGYLFIWVCGSMNHLCDRATGLGRTRWEIIHKEADDGSHLSIPFGSLVYVKETSRDTAPF